MPAPHPPGVSEDGTPTPGYHAHFDGLQWWGIDGRAGVFKSAFLAELATARMTDAEIAALQGTRTHLSMKPILDYLKARDEALAKITEGK